MPDTLLEAEPEALVTTTFRVGRRYRVTLTVPRFAPGDAIGLACTWKPDLPKRLSKSEMRDYRRGRDAAMNEVARLIGGNVMIVEV